LDESALSFSDSGWAKIGSALEICRVEEDCVLFCRLTGLSVGYSDHRVRLSTDNFKPWAQRHIVLSNALSCSTVCSLDAIIGIL
jgi:hypothetical protein